MCVSLTGAVRHHSRRGGYKVLEHFYDSERGPQKNNLILLPAFVRCIVPRKVSTHELCKARMMLGWFIVAAGVLWILVMVPSTVVSSQEQSGPKHWFMTYHKGLAVLVVVCGVEYMMAAAVDLAEALRAQDLLVQRELESSARNR